MENEIIFSEELHSYELNGVSLPSVTQILKAAGFYNFNMINKELLESKKILGSAVHKVTELYDLNTLDDYDERLNPYLDSWKKFCSDFKLIFKADQVEKIVNTNSFAGTLDRICVYDDRLTIIDIKTSFKYQPPTDLQLAGYSLAYQNMYNTTVLNRWSVNLSPLGYNITICKNIKDYKTFMSAVELFYYKKENGVKYE